MPTHVLLVEDHKLVAEPIVKLFESYNYIITWTATLEESREALVEKDYDLLILDVMLPESEDAGFELATEFRSAGYEGYILFLTARDSLEDRIKGLELGGDDYLVKPFELTELLARSKALIRRNVKTKTTEFSRDRLRVDFSKQIVWWDDTEVDLSEKEYDFLEYFCLNPDKSFSRFDLVDRFFQNLDSGESSVKVYVHRLRKKIDANLIKTTHSNYQLGLLDRHDA